MVSLGLEEKLRPFKELWLRLQCAAAGADAAGFKASSAQQPSAE